MPDMVINTEIVQSKLARLKTDKSPLDQLHPRVLYECREVISYTLYIIYMKSLSLGIVPTDWKLAEVTALYKKGSKSDRGNYRPISLTSVCCKILQQLIRDDLMTYLLGNDLISNRQYGFVKGRSTSLHACQLSIIDLLYKNVHEQQLNSRFPVFPEVVNTLLICCNSRGGDVLA